VIRKDFQDNDQLLATFKALVNSNGTVYAETDMRAHLNPTRMKNIQLAGKKLIESINNRCPSCHAPGFDVTATQSGLHCSLCGSATRSILSYTRHCRKCNFEHVEMYPNGKKVEDPTYCDSCNP
jgi:hypothetical protein